MSSTSCHCLRRSPSFLPPFVSGVGVPKPTRSSWPLNKSLRLVECHSRSSKNKWKISCFKDEESSSYIPESEFSGDKLPEELVELELGQSSVVERGWVSNLQEEPRGEPASGKWIWKAHVPSKALSSKSAFRRHQQWLQHAKTRSARHKIIKFLKEQAALSAIEITADTVNNFVADVEDESDLEEFSKSPKNTEPMWKKVLVDVPELSYLKRSNDDPLHIHNGKAGVLKVNGKHNKNVQDMSLKGKGEVLSQGNGIAELMHANIPMYREVLPGLDSWKTGKVASWHNLEGHSIQWFCVICIDRRGMMAEVTSVLTAVGISICSCVAEIDRIRGMGVMLFHIQGNLDSLVNACSSVDLILGVLGWSTGCSWPSSSENQRLLEC